MCVSSFISLPVCLAAVLFFGWLRCGPTRLQVGPGAVSADDIPSWMVRVLVLGQPVGCISVPNRRLAEEVVPDSRHQQPSPPAPAPLSSAGAGDGISTKKAGSSTGGGGGVTESSASTQSTAGGQQEQQQEQHQQVFCCCCALVIVLPVAVTFRGCFVDVVVFLLYYRCSCVLFITGALLHIEATTREAQKPKTFNNIVSTACSISVLDYSI